MSRTDQSAQAVGPLPVVGAEPAQQRDQLGVQRREAVDEPDGLHRAQCGGGGSHAGNVAPTARGAKAALTPPSATLIFRGLSR